jgi:hypothetical protein
MMFGGQVDQHDFHHIGLNVESMKYFLVQAGFNEVYRVSEFGLFEDTSSMRHGGKLISLNVIAIR